MVYLRYLVTGGGCDRVCLNYKLTLSGTNPTKSHYSIEPAPSSPTDFLSIFG